MTSVVILCFASVLLFIQATPCNHGQQCEDCSKTGACVSKCYPGYFNKECTSKCSSGCKHKLCKLTNSGFDECILGCIPGFQGTRCNIPCEHHRQCTECKGECVDNYCQQGSVCVSECVDSYYGLDCKNCSEQCQSCNRSTGICDQCHSPYTGPNCEMSCENCKGTCKAGCEEGCNPGFYGHWCQKVCSENCRPDFDAITASACDIDTSINCIPECNNRTGECIHGCTPGLYGHWCEKKCSENCRPDAITASTRDIDTPNTCTPECDNNTGHCIHGCNPGFYGHWCEKVCRESCLPEPDRTSSSACDKNAPNNCTPECDNNTGDCIHGCNVGWYGTNCSSLCNSKCENLSCTESGACADGCAPGYAGTDCSCYENCIDHVCHAESGTCAEGCDNGYYGAFCNNSCEICIDSICDRQNGTCTKGCKVTDHGCKSTCSGDCPMDYCLKEITCAGKQPAVDSSNIIIGVLTVLCLGGVLFASFTCLRKYSSTRSTNQVDHYLEAYRPSSMYWEIADEAVDLEGQPLNDEANDEQLREVQDRDTDHDAASDGTSEDSLSYSHLVRDIPSDDETTVYHKYIPPAEEITTNN